MNPASGPGRPDHGRARLGHEADRKRLLPLERGDFLTREPPNWDPGSVASTQVRAGQQKPARRTSVLTGPVAEERAVGSAHCQKHSSITS